MYVPARNAEHRPELLHDFMEAQPFVALVTRTEEDFFATHLPIVFHRDRGPHGTIEGHFARANHHHRHIASRPGALCIFSGSDAYITPSWYPGKSSHGEEVPTWNYIAVHAYGTIILHDDHDFLARHLEELTTRSEARRDHSWKVSDARPAFIAGWERAIVGFEMPVARLEGKWKMSQNRSPADIDGVVRGLTAAASPSDAAVATIVQAVQPA